VQSNPDLSFARGTQRRETQRNRTREPAVARKGRRRSARRPFLLVRWAIAQLEVYRISEHTRRRLGARSANRWGSCEINRSYVEAVRLLCPLPDVSVRAFDVRVQGMNGLGPIGARLIRAGLFLSQPISMKPLISLRFIGSLESKKRAWRQDRTALPYAATSTNPSTGHVPPTEVLAKALKRRSSARRCSLTGDPPCEKTCAPMHTIKLTETPKIVPQKWVHQDEERRGTNWINCLRERRQTSDLAPSFIQS
jgi:hypothetical protein